jgi:hypothetical protein
VRIHGAGKHALELELGDVALEPLHILLDRLGGRGVVLLLGQRQELAGFGDAVCDLVQGRDDLLEPGALAPELLGLLGSVPDRGIFQLAVDLRQPLALGVVLKDTS